jgi:hypothetical protein
MREHTHLPAVVGFVRKHVAQHFQANRPRPSPAVSAKLLDAAPAIAERFGEHFRAASGAFGQSRAGLLRRAVRAVELSWNVQVRSCKPDPLGADIVHMREDRGNRADVARRFGWRFGFPGGRVNMFDKNLVHAIIGGKDLNCDAAELSVNLVLTRGHGSYSLTYNTSGPSAKRRFLLYCGLALPSISVLLNLRLLRVCFVKSGAKPLRQLHGIIIGPEMHEIEMGPVKSLISSRIISNCLPIGSLRLRSQESV